MCGNCEHDHHHHAAGSQAEPVSGAKFKVEDMTCSHCESTIRKALQKNLPGAAVSIDLEGHEVTVAGDKAIAEQAIRNAGYEPVTIAG